MAAVSADGSTVWVLILRLNSSCSRSMAFVVRALRHWLGGRRVNVKSRSPASSKLSANGAVLEPPFADEGFAARFNLLGCRRIDQEDVVGADLLVQALGGRGEQVAMLVYCAPLHRHAVPDSGNCLFKPWRAVDDEELGPSQTALDEIIEDSAPCLGAFAAHALDCEQYLLAVLAHTDNDEQRDGSRLTVEPHAHHGAVENEPHDRLVGQRTGVPGIPVGLHLAPHPAHGVLAHRAAEQGRERTAHPARVGA